MSKPWFTVAFLNTWGNSIDGGRNFKDRVRFYVRDTTFDHPDIVAFAEVRDSQKSEVTRLMAAKGYNFDVYIRANMLAVYSRDNIDVTGASFAQFKVQDGGNKEGVLRVKFRVGNSNAQIGVLHLDHDSAQWKKISNLRETVAALKRFGAKDLGRTWRSRTVIIGDFNDTAVGGKVLRAFGFKEIKFGAKLDKAWVGLGRSIRGFTKTYTKSDHPRILVKVGRR